ncbi:MAG: hypothetical protein QOJ15_7635 [Bradyrhizobium sp.]|jgi:hypothetical protein|nr:hypothetical protein [Bradyrhizobium sp.]
MSAYQPEFSVSVPGVVVVECQLAPQLNHPFGSMLGGRKDVEPSRTDNRLKDTVT